MVNIKTFFKNMQIEQTIIKKYVAMEISKCNYCIQNV